MLVIISVFYICEVKFCCSLNLRSVTCKSSDWVFLKTAREQMDEALLHSQTLKILLDYFYVFS